MGKSSISRMQGVSANIEYHWEAVPKHDFSVNNSCVYCKGNICSRKEAPFYEKECAGFAGCSFCITPNRFANIEAKRIKQMKKRRHQQKAMKEKKDTLRDKYNSGGYSLGNDPRLKKFFDEINSAHF